MTLGRGGVHAWVLRRFAPFAADRVRWLSLLEQGLISAANFLSLLLLARHLPPRSFGIFSFAWLTLQFAVNLHRSAVVVPFVIHTAGPGTMEADGSAWRRLNLLTAIVLGGMLAAAGWALPHAGGAVWMGRAILVAALFVGPSFAYEFRRRWLIQNDRYGFAVIAAMAYCAVLLTGIVSAAAAISLPAAIVAFAGANGVAALAASVMAPRLRRGPQASFLAFVRRLFAFIGWSVMANLAYNGYYHLPPLLLGAVAGPVPVAVYQALRSFLQPLATVVTAIDNFDKPRAARALAAHGFGGLRYALGGTTAALVGFSGPYLLAMLVAGRVMVEVVYGNRYGDASSVLIWFAAMHVATICAYPFETALLLLGRPELVFRGRIAAAAVGIGVCLSSVRNWGLEGALAGLVAGLVVSGIAALFNLRRISPWIVPK